MTGHWRGDTTGDGWIPLTKAIDADILWCHHALFFQVSMPAVYTLSVILRKVRFDTYTLLLYLYSALDSPH